MVWFYVLCFVHLTHLFLKEQSCCSTTTVNTHTHIPVFDDFLVVGVGGVNLLDLVAS